MKQISSQSQIVSDSPFPKAITLEDCSLNVRNGYHDYVLKTLKAFSNKEDFKAKNPHSLNKSSNVERYFKIAKELKPNSSPKVISLDVKSRNDTKRLFYCEDSKNVCHILALCSEETH